MKFTTSLLLASASTYSASALSLNRAAMADQFNADDASLLAEVDRQPKLPGCPPTVSPAACKAKQMQFLRYQQQQARQAKKAKWLASQAKLKRLAKPRGYAEVEDDDLELAEVAAEVDAEVDAEAEVDADADVDMSGEAAQAAVAAVQLGYDIGKDIGNLIWNVTGGYKPYMHMWNFDLHNGKAEKWLAEDRIRVERKPNTCSSCGRRGVKICLKTPGWMTWWKGVSVHANNRFMYNLVQNQDRRHDDCAKIEYKELIKNYITLGKAKFWGAHTNMYWVQNSYAFMPGNDWHITWLND